MYARLLSFMLIAVFTGGPLGAQSQAAAANSVTRTLAAAPPMGWNSWSAFGLTITEEQFRTNVSVFAAKLKPFGWNYVVIDEGWFFENPQDREHAELLHYGLDKFGRYVPVPVRFPSAVVAGAPDPIPSTERGMLPATLEETSFAALGEWVHAQGLRFGIHIVRGIPRASVERNLPIEGSGFTAADVADKSDACPWDPTNWGVKNNDAGQAWYDSILRQYAAWGVDLIKVDCIADHPYKSDEIRMIRRAIDKTGRPIVLSLSPGPTAIEHAEEVGSLAQMWRISDDFWDYWKKPTTKDYPQSLLAQFDKLNAWSKFARPGNWPDADMLILGELRPVPGEGKPRATRFTPDEQQTLMTLWSVARSPLILGGNLTMLDNATQKLLTNPDVIRVDQTSTGSRQVSREGDLVVWTSDLAGGSHAVAFFNVGDTPATVTKAFSGLGLTAKNYAVSNAWTGQRLGRLHSAEAVVLAPHASALWVLRK